MTGLILLLLDFIFLFFVLLLLLLLRLWLLNRIWFLLFRIYNLLLLLLLLLGLRLLLLLRIFFLITFRFFHKIYFLVFCTTIPALFLWFLKLFLSLLSIIIFMHFITNYCIIIIISLVWLNIIFNSNVFSR